MSIIRSYDELIELSTHEDRLRYLQLMDRVGEDTFGYDRWINQRFYSSIEWKRARNLVINRDNGLDLGVAGFLIFGQIIVHHINPITKDDIINGRDTLFDLNNLICVSHDTHNSIHYGKTILTDEIVERRPGDTCPWKEIES